MAIGYEMDEIHWLENLKAGLLRENVSRPDDGRLINLTVINCMTFVGDKGPYVLERSCG